MIFRRILETKIKVEREYSMNRIFEIEFIMNANFLKQSIEAWEEVRRIVDSVPPTATLFYKEDKKDELEMIDRKIADLKELLQEENRQFFRHKGI